MIDSRDIVDIATRQENPHTTGRAHCLACGHRWIAVAPVGTVWMDCPVCEATKGLMDFTCEMEGAAHWVCACGNDLFHATPEGFYCPNCGEWQHGF